MDSTKAPQHTPSPMLPLVSASHALNGSSGHTTLSSLSASGSGAPAQLESSQIDEQWIAVARDVVSRTQDDPYSQSEELAKVKASYVNARYSDSIATLTDSPK